MIYNQKVTIAYRLVSLDEENVWESHCLDLDLVDYAKSLILAEEKMCSLIKDTVKEWDAAGIDITTTSAPPQEWREAQEEARKSPDSVVIKETTITV